MLLPCVSSRFCQFNQSLQSETCEARITDSMCSNPGQVLPCGCFCHVGKQWRMRALVDMKNFTRPNLLKISESSATLITRACEMNFIQLR